MNTLICSYRCKAGYKDRTWELTREQFKELTSSPCHYCGAAPAQVAKPSWCKGYYVYNGIDRYDNGRGYEPDNVVPCCWDCNRIKGAMGGKEFETWLDRVVSHRQGGSK